MFFVSGDDFVGSMRDAQVYAKMVENKGFQRTSRVRQRRARLSVSKYFLLQYMTQIMTERSMLLSDYFD